MKNNLKVRLLDQQPQFVNYDVDERWTVASTLPTEVVAVLPQHFPRHYYRSLNKRYWILAIITGIAMWTLLWIVAG